MRRANVKVFLVLLVTHCLCGCTAGTSDVQSPAQLPPGTYNYVLGADNLRTLDTTSSQYVLWFEMRDTRWQAVPLRSWTTAKGIDSLSFRGLLATFPDSIVRTVLSIEPRVIPSTPSAKIMGGNFTGAASNSARLLSTDSDGTGDYSGVTGSVLFTTKSSDTNRAKQEFYFMRDSNGVFTASLVALPKPNAGWVYGAWVVDSNFYPKRTIFYGYFTSVGGVDSKPNNAAYPFPGGFNPAQLNDPGASLLVSLDPAFADSTNHPEGPSPITVLSTPLARFIDYNQTIAMKNVWRSSAVRGTLQLWR